MMYVRSMSINVKWACDVSISHVSPAPSPGPVAKGGVDTCLW